MKWQGVQGLHVGEGVAPLAGAGIEIGSNSRTYMGRSASPLSQGRELKFAAALLRGKLRVSPLSQGRELK